MYEEFFLVFEMEGVSSLEYGKWTDFIVLIDNPLEDIKNMCSIESVQMPGLGRRSENRRL